MSDEESVEPELTEEVEPEETEEPESEPEEAEESASEEAEPEAASEPELDDKASFKLGDKTVTGAELKAGYMRQQDYTRKTQELASERREVKAELSKASEENQEYKEFFQSLKDSKTLRLELLRYYPETYDELRAAIIAERLEEQDLSESEQKLRRKLERADAAEYARKKEQEYSQSRQERAETQSRITTMREQFDGWIGTHLAASGLDPKSQDHQDLVKSEIATRFRGQKWTEEHFKQAAARIAKTLGKSPAPAKAEPAKKLPPVRPQGLKAPAEARKPKPAPKKESGDAFDRLRAKYGGY